MKFADPCTYNHATLTKFVLLDCSPSRRCSMLCFVAFAGIDYLSRNFESWDIPGTSSSSTLSTLRQASACSSFSYLWQRIAF